MKTLGAESKGKEGVRGILPWKKHNTSLLPKTPILTYFEIDQRIKITEQIVQVCSLVDEPVNYF